MAKRLPPSRKKAKNKSLLYNRVFVIGLVITLTFLLLAAVFIVNNTRKRTINNAAQNTNSNQISQEQDDTAKDIAMKEAREVAEAYFGAAKECDLEKANSYRLFPKNTSSKSECMAECPGGIEYRYIKDLAYNDDEIDGDRTELAVMLYYFSCLTKETTLQTYDTRIQLMRTQDDNIWRVINSL